MLNLMHELTNMDKSKKKPKKDRLIYDMNGNIMVAPKHRSDFDRFKRSFVYSIDPEIIQRFHYTADKDFQRLLLRYNNTNRDNVTFTCVGYANTRLRFCTRCFDLKKTKPQDMYFINKQCKSFSPEVFCFGCVGFTVRSFLNEQFTTLNCSLIETNV